MSYIIDACGVSVSFADGTRLFENFNFSVSQEKIGLVGKNGVGKTSLLKVLTREIILQKGVLNIFGRVSCMPQNTNELLNLTLSQVLNIEFQVSEFEKTINSKSETVDNEIMCAFWNLKHEMIQILNFVNLSFLIMNNGSDNENTQYHKFLDFNRKCDTLSGGELMRLLLAKVLLEKPDLILMDEPTNNLDENSKKLFIDVLTRFKGGLFVVSHDRKLLNKMDKIFEISNLGLKTYGGNFDFYFECKQREQCAALNDVQYAREELKKQIKTAQEVHQRQTHRMSQGKKSVHKKGLSRIEIGKRVETAQNTVSKLRMVHGDNIEQSQKKLSCAWERVRDLNKINFDIKKVHIPNSKQMIVCRDLNYKYESENLFLWKEHLNFEILGPDRVALCGNNGSGKTTLIKLIMGQLMTQWGSVYCGSKDVAYLDQSCSFLDPQKSILENLKNFSSPELKIHELRIRAGRFLFYGDDVHKKVSCLSGGERLRVALACLLSTYNTPEILILDEPTNNLDLESIKILTDCLNEYNGVLIVVSHDEYFLNDLNIDQKIILKK